MKKILIDTCYWIALLNERDQHHLEAQKIEASIEFHTFLVPWPTMFECVNTRSARRKDITARFMKFLMRSNTEFIDDTPYREESLRFVLSNHHHTLSLTDHVLRSMMSDDDLSIDAFLSFNLSDFYDVCANRGIELIQT